MWLIREGFACWLAPDTCGQEFSVGASIGVAEVTPELADIAAVLQAADSACYDAKKGGRNRVATYVPRQSAP